MQQPQDQAASNLVLRPLLLAWLRICFRNDGIIVRPARECIGHQV